MKPIIYHNPKCSKSRTTLDILKDKASDFEVIYYLKNPPNANQLKQLLKSLNLSARALIRTSEAEYAQQNLADNTLTEDDLIQAMIATPKLIERPIVKTDKGVVVARPPEKVLTIL